jgi:hypothetical protein
MRQGKVAKWLRKVGIKPEIVIAVAGLLLGFVGYLWWSHDPLATLEHVVGTTERDSKKALGQFQAARAHDEFFEGDGARTRQASEAKFRLPGGASSFSTPSWSSRDAWPHR